MDPLESGIRADADAQNEALYNILTTELKVKTPEYKDLNGIIARVMSGFTSGFTASSEWAWNRADYDLSFCRHTAIVRHPYSLTSKRLADFSSPGQLNSDLRKLAVNMGE
jgi:hypothetical protein